MSRRPAQILVLLALVAGACGGSAQEAVVDDGIVELRLTDYRIEPQIVRARKDSLTIRVVNAGRLPHAFRIRGAGGTRLKVSTLMPGEEAARVGVTLPRGDWRLFCPLANHEELGMYGTLVIR